MNENIDVIRVQGLAADLPTTLRKGMIGFASDDDRMAYRRLDTGAMKYWSDDSKQCLLAGSQTVTGSKTFSAQQNFEGRIYSEDRITMLGQWDFQSSEVSSITDGVTNLDPAVSPHILITNSQSLPASATVGISAGTTFGQILIVTCSDRSGLEFDDSVSGSAELFFSSSEQYLTLDPGETAAFMWQEGITGNDRWVLIFTTGNLSG